MDASTKRIVELQMDERTRLAVDEVLYYCEGAMRRHGINLEKCKDADRGDFILAVVSFMEACGSVKQVSKPVMPQTESVQ